MLGFALKIGLEHIGQDTPFIMLFFGFFSLSHGVPGMYFMAYAYRLRKQELRRLDLEEMYPDQPSRWRWDWDQSRSEMDCAPVWPLVYAVFASLSVGCLYTLCALTSQRDDWIAKPLIVLVLLPGAILVYLLWRFGRRARLGRSFAVEIPEGGFVPDSDLQLSLVLEDGKRMRMHQLDLNSWSLQRVLRCLGEKDSDGDRQMVSMVEQKIALHVDTDGQGAVLRGRIPENAPPTDSRCSSEKGRAWQVVGRSREGIDLGPFDLPVFDFIGIHRPNPVERVPEFRTSDLGGPEVWIPRLANERIIADWIPGGYRFQFRRSPGDWLLIALGCLVGGAFTGVALFALLLHLGEREVPNALSLFGVVGVSALLFSLLEPFKSRSFEVSQAGISKVTTYFGFIRTRKMLAAKKIKDLEIQSIGDSWILVVSRPGLLGIRSMYTPRRSQRLVVAELEIIWRRILGMEKSKADGQ